MAEVVPSASFPTEVEVPPDLLAGLLIEQASARSAEARAPDRLPAKVYGVMAVTTLLTFATLTTGYQLFFTHPLFA